MASIRPFQPFVAIREGCSGSVETGLAATKCDLPSNSFWIVRGFRIKALAGGTKSNCPGERRPGTWTGWRFAEPLVTVVPVRENRGVVARRFRGDQVGAARAEASR